MTWCEVLWTGSLCCVHILMANPLMMMYVCMCVYVTVQEVGGAGEGPVAHLWPEPCQCHHNHTGECYLRHSSR